MQPLSSATGCEFVQVRIRAGIIIGLRPWIPTTKEQECRLDIILTPRPSCECQGLARAQWIADRQAELLEVPYFHVVFTVPMAIEVIAFQNQTVIYDILFRSASETLRIIAADPQHLGAEIGFLGVLHTWGQNLLHHPHIHFLVPGGGIAPDGKRWIACRRGFFLPVRVLSRMFRGRFLHYLEQAFRAGELNFFSAHRHLHEPAVFLRYLAPVWNTEWVIYAKRPFAGPAQVLEYIGRYTHRVAISNNRLVSMDNGRIRFRWKDYRDGNRQNGEGDRLPDVDDTHDHRVEPPAGIAGAETDAGTEHGRERRTAKADQE